MKKVIFSIALAALVFFGGQAKAQLTGTAVLTATLTDVITVVSLSAPIFLFTTADHYNNGLTVNETGTLVVSSNMPFDLSVQSATANLAFLTNEIPVSNFTVQVTNAGGDAIDPVALSTTAQQIVNEGTAGILRALNLTYATAGGADFIGKPAGAYVATLTYTVSVD